VADRGLQRSTGALPCSRSPWRGTGRGGVLAAVRGTQLDREHSGIRGQPRPADRGLRSSRASIRPPPVHHGWAAALEARPFPLGPVTAAKPRVVSFWFAWCWKEVEELPPGRNPHVTETTENLRADLDRARRRHDEAPRAFRAVEQREQRLRTHRVMTTQAGVAEPIGDEREASAIAKAELEDERREAAYALREAREELNAAAAAYANSPAAEGGHPLSAVGALVNAIDRTIGPPTTPASSPFASGGWPKCSVTSSARRRCFFDSRPTPRRLRTFAGRSATRSSSGFRWPSTPRAGRLARPRESTCARRTRRRPRPSPRDLLAGASAARVREAGARALPANPAASRPGAAPLLRRLARIQSSPRDRPDVVDRRVRRDRDQRLPPELRSRCVLRGLFLPQRCDHVER
jgi:hypothetical protein